MSKRQRFCSLANISNSKIAEEMDLNEIKILGGEPFLDKRYINDTIGMHSIHNILDRPSYSYHIYE